MDNSEQTPKDVNTLADAIGQLKVEIANLRAVLTGGVHPSDRYYDSEALAYKARISIEAAARIIERHGTFFDGTKRLTAAKLSELEARPNGVSGW
jgi:hypothetical protein